MGSEYERFLDALRFLTIARVPASGALQPDWLARSIKYFPLVGVLVGLVSAAVLVLSSTLLGPKIGALLAIASSIAATGALHEDGLADTADAFGGGRTVEKRLEIMKDSRIGTYGALALGIGVAIRFLALSELPVWIGAPALVGLHATARVTPAVVLNVMAYAGDIGSMKVRHSGSRTAIDEIGLALGFVLLALLPLGIVNLQAALLGVSCGGLLAAGLARRSQRLIGGYTGDVLGATEQCFEIGFILGVVASVR